MCGNSRILLKKGWGRRKTGVGEGNHELTLLLIMISVRWDIPLGMVEELKVIVHSKSCGGITNRC